VTASAGFTISLSENGTFTSTPIVLNSNPSDLGDVENTTIYVRYNTTPGGTVTGTLTVASERATTQVIELTGSDNITSVSKSVDNTGSVAVYPNPSEGEATLLVDFVQAGQIEVNVYSLAGTTVYSFFDYVNGPAAYPLTGLSKGIYIVRVSNGSTVKTVKLVVK
jgi:hypothetical protein